MFGEVEFRNIFDDFLTTELRKIGLSVRPSFYSGRGATTTDLRDEHLEALFQVITKEKGEPAGKDFAQMVADIRILSATDFLLSLAAFQNNGFRWNKSLLGEQNGRYAEDFATGLGTLMASMGRQGDDTVSIRSMFLRRHDIEDPRAGERGYRGYDYFGRSV